MEWYTPCSKTFTYDIVQSYIPNEINIISCYIPIIPWMEETLDQLADGLSPKKNTVPHCSQCLTNKISSIHKMVKSP